ncbi:hypothetical protein [Sphingomonas sp. PB4P5]
MTGRITAVERDRIVHWLRTMPLPEVRQRSGRTFVTLARIAQSVETPA